MVAFSTDVLLIGGGPSIMLHESAWRIPRMAINKHAHEAGIRTDYYVGCDVDAHHPQQVLNDETIEKWIPSLEVRVAQMGHYPNMHFFGLCRPFDSITMGAESSERKNVVLTVTFRSMLMAIRLSTGFGYKNLFFIGCDMSEPEHYILRERIALVAGPLLDDRGVRMYDLNPSGGVEGLASVTLDGFATAPRTRRPTAEGFTATNLKEKRVEPCKSSDSSTPKPITPDFRGSI
jgi:hypothetical protein